MSIGPMLLAAMSTSIVESRALPVWLGWAGLAIAAVNFLDGFDLLSEMGVALLDFIFFLGWILAAGVVLVIKPRAQGS